MSKRIDCTLTDAQWHELISACAERACVLEEQGDYEGDEGVAAATRQRGADPIPRRGFAVHPRYETREIACRAGVSVR